MAELLSLGHLNLANTSHHPRRVDRRLPPSRCIVARCAVSTGGCSCPIVVVRRRFTLSRDGRFAQRSHLRQKVTLRAKRQPVFVLVLHFILFGAGYPSLGIGRVLFDGPPTVMMRTGPNHALQRTQPSRSGCNPHVPWGGSLSLVR